ncbi:17032_t:CDS:2 [Cetraspora pellucida]|uniref:17032_t:CDS:1 n=1 Tax=Cetraspora pellucida TaxID=1433469 RepID=A0ACA9KN62_9GLOM|nr:17032_t:CDS:2 [Cetraspora pellucida]
MYQFIKNLSSPAHHIANLPDVTLGLQANIVMQMDVYKEFRVDRSKDSDIVSERLSNLPDETKNIRVISIPEYSHY